jgi:ferric-dicitrate binding protein FerR (iron transport regulator)
MRFYTTNLYAPPGQHVSKTLPDGSNAHLNAGTELSYHPHWWRFARVLELEGEAYFEVKKGNRFTVRSPQGATEVLGTSFNIYARGNKYRVHCLTGQIRVETEAGKIQILKPNQAISVSEKGEMEYQNNIKPQHAIAWTKNRFVYTATPLREVFREMERQFDITIDLDPGIKGEYTGNFQRGSSPETLLKLIARPFGLEVKQIHQTKYRIKKGED